MSGSRRRRHAPPAWESTSHDLHTSPPAHRGRGGIDPSPGARAGRRGPDRKLLQLCAQVSEALHLALGESRATSDLLVDAVRGYPGAGRLLVLVRPGRARGALDRAALLAELARASGHLRSEVAAAIHRKRAPALVFELAPGDEPGSLGEEEE